MVKRYFYFDTNATEAWRQNTESASKNFQMTLNRRTCNVCGQNRPVTGGKVIKGTSRHNPSRFTCANCVGDKK